MSGHAAGEGGDAVAAYKAILQRIIDKRPSGMRLKIAQTLGKHKSFVSQITNPAYPVPVPARHIEAIFEICRFSPEERQSFMAAYERAHPGRAQQQGQVSGEARPHTTITVDLPMLHDQARQAELEDMIRHFAHRLAALLEKG